MIEVDGNVIETAARSGDSARGTDSTKLDKRARLWVVPPGSLPILDRPPKVSQLIN